jgi:hypothetical protein
MHVDLKLVVYAQSAPSKYQRHLHHAELFDRAAQHRTISLNAHYMVQFKNLRNKSQTDVLSR